MQLLNNHCTIITPKRGEFMDRNSLSVTELTDNILEQMIKVYSSQCAANGTPMPDKPHCHMRKSYTRSAHYEEEDKYIAFGGYGRAA